MSITVADKQRISYRELLDKVIPEYLNNAGYIKDTRYGVTFELYPIDSINAVEENGNVFTTLKTFCRIEDFETGEYQEIVIDLLNIPVYQELGFKVGGNYKQVLDLYEKPAGWSFSKVVDNTGTTPIDVISAKLMSANYKTFQFVGNNKTSYFYYKRSKAIKDDSADTKVPISVLFRALTGYNNKELLELFGYDNSFNSLCFSDNVQLRIGSKTYNNVPSRGECIEKLYRTLFGAAKADETKDLETRLKNIMNWFFKKAYMNLGTGNRKRFEYAQSFRSRALNKVLAEDVILHDEVLHAGTILNTAKLELIDNSPIDCIKVKFNGKIHSLHKFSTFTFRALGFKLAETVITDNIEIKAGKKLDLNDLTALNNSDIDTIQVYTSDAKGRRVETISRNADGSTLTIEDMFTAYSIFANNLNGYEYYNDVDELTDKIVVTLDKKILLLVEKNLNNFITKLNEGLDLVKNSNTSGKIIDALSDFSMYINKYELLEALTDLRNTESQLSDYNNVISFIAKDFKVSNKGSGNTTTDSLISVHGLQFGRLDPYDSPESNKIGKVHHRTILAKEDENGYLLAPYLVVDKGIITDKVEYLTATEEKDVYVAEWSETFKNEDGSKKDRVRVRYQGELQNVETDLVTYKEYSNIQNLSPTTGCIPFCNFAAGKRIQMSDNQQKQAVSTLKTERPLVCTGVESLLNIGVYRASDVLTRYYDEQEYNCKELISYKEKILNSDLQLIRIADNNNKIRKLVYKVIAAKDLDISNLDDEVTLEIPFAQNTLKSDMFSYKINSTTGGYYKSTDVLAYNSSYDMKDYNISGIMDYGALEFDEKQLKGSVALGHNYLVAFKTMESSSIDDGIVISSGIVADDTITSIMIHKETVELIQSSNITEQFEAPRDRVNGDIIENFTIDGLPKVGTYLANGDVVAWKKVIYNNLNRTTRYKEEYKKVTLNPYVEGQVISTKFTTKSSGKCAEIYIACRSTGEVADKFAGRIGNKGVIAKIIPEEMMPYDPVTGKTVDFILSPLGVPSRMNITQLLEVTLAAAAAKKGEIAVVSPFHPDSLEYVLDSAEQAGIKPIKLVDGRTGKFFEREINVGYQYMYKLVHMARKNIHAVGLQHGINAITLQAKQSAKLNGGQSIGEMESWCLESIGAFKVLQELQTTLSDDREARNELEHSLRKDPYYVDITGTNHNDVTMTSLLRLLGAEVSTGIDSSGDTYYEFGPLKDETIRSFSLTEVTKDSLHSSEIFGSNNGVINKMNDRHRWGWIDLGTEIIHPIWVEKGNLNSLLIYRNPIPSCGFPEDEADFKWNRTDSFGKQSILSNFINNSIFVRCTENIMDKLFIITRHHFVALNDKSKALYKTGFEAISFIFRHYSVQRAATNIEFKITNRNKKEEQSTLTLDEMKVVAAGGDLDEARKASYKVALDSICVIDDEDPSNVYEFVESEKSLVTMMKNLTEMKNFISNGSSLQDYLITSFPVMPAIYRQSMELQGRPVKNDFDVHYEAIIDAAKTAKVNDSESNKFTVYKAIANFIGLGKSESRNATILSWFVGKTTVATSSKHHGAIRETVQKKIVGRAGRSIIIPSDDPSRGPQYLGLPLSMAVIMYEEQLISHLWNYFKVTPGSNFRVKHFHDLFVALSSNNIVKFRNVYTEYFESLFMVPVIRAKTQLIAWIKEFIEGTDSQPVGPNGIVIEPQVVIAGRQPSLHRYSIRAYYPKIVFTRAIQVHPLVCSGYNADFDGDQMWVAALLSEEAKAEALAKMTVQSDIINPKDGKIILTHSQDIALGIYTLTMLKDNSLQQINKDVNYFYSSVELLREDILQGDLHPYDLVSIYHKGKHFVSTAGRILFNSLLPDGFSAETGSFQNKLELNIAKPERFAELQYDGLITSGKGADGELSYSLPDICKKLYDSSLSGELTTQSLLDIYQSISELGFRISDRYSVSISIFDFREIAEKSGKKKILEEAEQLQKAIEKDYQDGLLSDTDKTNCMNDIYKKAFSDIEIDIFGNGKELPGVLDRNNNIFIMFDSGARGSKSQIMQSIGVVGKLQKTKTEDLELPVLRNYSEGLSSFDFQMISYSTRTGMASAQNESQNAGYGTRRAVHCTSGLEIVELDCGKTNWWYDVEWDNRIEDLTIFKPSMAWFSNNLLGRAINLNDKDTIDLFGDTIQNGYITQDSFNKLSNGFHRISLKDSDITANIDFILGAIPLDDNSKKYLAQYTKDGYLTRDAIRIVNKRHMKQIVMDIGTLELRYHLSKLTRSLLENREGRNMPGLRLYDGPLHRRLRSPMYIITNDTLDWIEKSGTERIEARILMDCEIGRNDNGASNKTLHGCCARCYGLKYTSNTLPEINENVGIEAAQAIAEPAAQLTLSLVNKGGAAGESVASGIDILHKLLNGTNLFVDQAKTPTYVARESGYLSIETLDKEAIVTLSPDNTSVLEAPEFLNDMKQVTRINPKTLICKNKEWINAGEAITSGYVLPNNIIRTPEGTIDSLIRAKQVVWLYNWFKTFDDNNISVNARHFELFTRAQMSDMTIVKSNNPAYEVGKRYKLSDVLSAGKGVVGVLETSDVINTVLNSSGALAVLSYENIAASLPKLVQKSYRSYKNSPIGALNLGENLVTKEKKKLQAFTQKNYDVGYRISEDDNNALVFTVANDTSEALSSMDLFSDLKDFDLDEIPSEPKDNDLDILLDDMLIEQSSDKAIPIKDMNLFDTDDKTINNEEGKTEEPINDNLLCDVVYALLHTTDYSPVSGIDAALLSNELVIQNVVSDDAGNIKFTNVPKGVYTIKLLTNLIQGDTEKMLHVTGTETNIDAGIWSVNIEELPVMDALDYDEIDDDDDNIEGDEIRYVDDYDYYDDEDFLPKHSKMNMF